MFESLCGWVEADDCSISRSLKVTITGFPGLLLSHSYSRHVSACVSITNCGVIAANKIKHMQICKITHGGLRWRILWKSVSSACVNFAYRDSLAQFHADKMLFHLLKHWSPTHTVFSLHLCMCFHCLLFILHFLTLHKPNLYPSRSLTLNTVWVTNLNLQFASKLKLKTKISQW